MKQVSNIEDLKKQLYSANKWDQISAIKRIGIESIDELSSDVYRLYMEEICRGNDAKLKYDTLDTLGRLRCPFIIPEMERLLEENAPYSVPTKAAALNYVRYERIVDQDISPILKLLRRGDAAVCSGAISAIRKDHIVLSNETFSEILSVMMNERVDFFERRKAIDPREDLLFASEAWIHLDPQIVQPFIDWCAKDDYLSRFDVVLLHKTSHFKLDAYLVEIENYFEENDSSETICRIMLCIDDLINILDLSLIGIDSEHLELCRERGRNALKEQHPEIQLKEIADELRSLKGGNSSLHSLADMTFQAFISFFSYPIDADSWAKCYKLTFFSNALIEMGEDLGQIESVILKHFSDVIG